MEELLAVEAAEEPAFAPSPAPLTLAGDAPPISDSLRVASDLIPATQDLDDASEDEVAEAIRTISGRVSVEFGSTLVNPRSCAVGYQPPLPVTEESVAIAALLREARAGKLAEVPEETGDFVEFELSNFSIYMEPKHRPVELRSLHLLSTTRRGYSSMYFDGILSTGNLRHYVQRVPFCELPIGNYGVSSHTVGGEIWIRSTHNQGHRSEVYYRLTTPSVEYARFYRPFLWVVDLGKHFVDFCSWRLENKRPVTIRDFKINFSQWLRKTHKGSPEFERWYDQLGGRHDFRCSVAANVEHLWKETQGVLQQSVPLLRIFREIHSLTSYKPSSLPPAGVTATDASAVPPTVVTPYIKECFGHMRFGGILHAIDPALGATRKVHKANVSAFRQHVSHEEMIRGISPGSVVSTTPDTQESGTKWKRETAKGAEAENRWYALVQKVNFNKTGDRVFDVTWLYRPVDTPCGQMKYPWRNELFLSSHCTCKEGPESNIDGDEVLGVHDVEWFGGPNTTSEFFIRQFYQNVDRRFITLQKEHLTCAHTRSLDAGPYDGTKWRTMQETTKQTRTSEIPAHSTPGYAPNDTVYIVSGDVLEPCAVEEVYTDQGRPMACIRKFLRRTQVDKSAGAKPNELVYTSQFVHVKASKITGKCIVRAFRAGESIPTPYNREGVGNAFFMTHKQLPREGDGTLKLVPLEDGDVTFRQGFRPGRGRSLEKLQGLDLFCGCGNLGRGLEDGGAVEIRWANDIWDKAIHTYMANTDPSRVRPFLGSVDDLLRSALQGRFSDRVPRPGDVDVISAGSPCPGFSMLTIDKEAPKQVKNRSLVASFASFVDYYRPKYGILENVVNIVQTKARSEDIFSQLICAIVGLGYQVEIMLGNAWSYGAAQSRPRVFLCFAAAGLRLPRAPSPTHSNCQVAGIRAGLGKLSNNEYWVTSAKDPTPFRFVSAMEAAGDLPDIGDGRADICIPFPDHRLSVGVHNRQHVHCVPTQPYGMGFAKAWNSGNGVMTAAERECYPVEGRHRTGPTSRAWSRVHPHGLFNTVTTMCQFTDARVGKILHWQQQRPLTVMEARRAQGIPDDEVLLGLPSDQWKMVGNAVARQVSTVLGLALREAWLGSLYEGGDATEDVGLLELEGVALGESASSPIPADDDFDDDDDDDYDDDDDKSTVSMDNEQAPGSDTEVDSDTKESRKISPDSVSLVPLGAQDTPLTSDSEVAPARGRAKRSFSELLVIEIADKRPRVES